MRELYPEIEPFDTFALPVSDIHTLYVEQSGNPKGKPIIFVHGGPGGGTEPKHRRYFDPKKWRIILFDQRGCGQSKPFSCLEQNTTWDLVEDMEKIRKELAIERWHVFGGSWGSTLSLAYAETYPEKVLGLVLRGIFLLRRSEINWFYQFGASELYPDAWDDFIAPIPKEERHNLLDAYHQRLTHSDEKIVLEAAKAWSIWEGRTSKLIPEADFISHFERSDFAHAFARIECHYFKNGGFFEEDGWLLKNVDRIAEVPAIIVQGRYDMPCPVRSAYDLAKVWLKAKLQIVPDAGHAASEPGITEALLNATDHFEPPKSKSDAPSLWLGLGVLWVTLTESISMVVEATFKEVNREMADRHVKNFWQRLLKQTHTRLETNGLEHLRPDISYIYMSNHQSIMDIPAMLGAVPGSLRMVAKEGLFRVPFFGRAMKQAGFVPIDRRRLAKAKSQLELAKSSLQSGTNLWIAPEGTRSRKLALLPFKKGGFHVALALKVPIVPVWIDGAAQVVRADSLRVSPNGTIRVSFGRPIKTEDLNVADLPALMEKTRAAIFDLSS